MIPRQNVNYNKLIINSEIISEKATILVFIETDNVTALWSRGTWCYKYLNFFKFEIPIVPYTDCTNFRVKSINVDIIVT